MAIGTGDAIYKYGTQVTVTTAASSLTDGSVDSESKTAVTSDAPLCDLALKFQVGTTTAAGAAIHVYRRDLNIDGTNDAPAPDSNNKSTYVGSFLVPTSITTSTDYYLSLTDVPLSADCEFYIENDIGQTISSGWTLKATPKTYGASA